MKIAKAFSLIAVLFASMTAGIAQNAANLPIVTVMSPSLTTTGQTNPVGTYTYVPSGTPSASLHTIQANITGSPATCTFHVWGTTKTLADTPVYPTDYADLSGAIDCTTVTMIHIANKPVTLVLVQLSAMTGGTTPSVTFRYIGTR